jgi:DNA-binding transcriptional LysR family regulator
MSPTTVTRTIAALERSLGAPLLIRTTRTVRLTEDGTLFLQRCQDALGEIDDAFAMVRGGGREPHGTLTVTAPVMFGRLHVLPLVITLLRKHPALDVRLLLLDRVANLVEEGIDIAVRIGDPPDSALRLLKIGEVRRVFSASPDYLRERRAPTTPVELRDHTLIEIEDERGQHGRWQAAATGRVRTGLTRLSVNSMDAAISAAEAGLGIVRTLSYQVASHFADGRLVEVLSDQSTQTIPVQLLFQSGRRETPNIRAFLSLAREHLTITG